LKILIGPILAISLFVHAAPAFSQFGYTGRSEAEQRALASEFVSAATPLLGTNPSDEAMDRVGAIIATDPGPSGLRCGAMRGRWRVFDGGRRYSVGCSVVSANRSIDDALRNDVLNPNVVFIFGDDGRIGVITVNRSVRWSVNPYRPILTCGGFNGGDNAWGTVSNISERLAATGWSIKENVTKYAHLQKGGVYIDLFASPMIYAAFQTGSSQVRNWCGYDYKTYWHIWSTKWRNANIPKGQSRPRSLFQ